ncbi:MAG: helix-turn-helix domain-containing protein [Rickettsiales bacterium]|nr:helix-turn-helix domain-containing protein [Pseudomonadota bacterium]MDA0967425.1 helix-turn-helix domain-containing protein [Pseudomonadota bacterium]MDG4544207.1 helix-turn-helix domain-containing protein [Rickettsiales bacterium]MDG4546388.1 helix-turn-helix domain-containing protein [Rickettsiales bacterium]MDG4548531.1 helix-turn-helix domain-containing protein [Rickettsiales bacterium]
MKEVGSLLKETRESQGFKIEQAAKELKVRSEYLEVLESGDISSLSNEIYILGYLKSYSAWLGLNSNEITNRFRSLNNELSVNKGVSHDSSFFINVEDRMISSNKPVYLFCVLLLLIFFIFYKAPQSDDLSFVEGVGIELHGMHKHQYAGFAFKKEVHNKIMLMAKSDLGIKLNYSDNLVENEYLASGDVYFLPTDKNVLISSDSPENVDVFSDDERGKYLGTLQDFYIFN